MEFFIATIFLGFVPALIASSKGRSFFLWYVYGVALFIVALIHSIIIKKNDNAFVDEGMVKCPYCAEFVKKEAKVCRYCNRDLLTTCPYCKKPTNSTEKICPDCGEFSL